MVAKKKAKSKKTAKPKAAATKTAPIKKKSAEPKKAFYVGVADPLSKQRQLLQLTASYLRILQNIEKVKKTREQKKEMIAEFHKKMGVIRSDASKLYKLLPKYNLPHKVKPVEPKKPEVVEKRVEKPVEVAKAKTEIDSLEAELAAIEGRLTQM